MFHGQCDRASNHKLYAAVAFSVSGCLSGRKKGYGSTITTSAQGVLAPASTTAKTLLGQ